MLILNPAYVCYVWCNGARADYYRVGCVDYAFDGRTWHVAVSFDHKGKVPAFGVQFCVSGGFSAVAPRSADGSANTELLPYACGGV